MNFLTQIMFYFLQMVWSSSFFQESYSEDFGLPLRDANNR